MKRQSIRTHMKLIFYEIFQTNGKKFFKKKPFVIMNITNFRFVDYEG